MYGAPNHEELQQRFRPTGRLDAGKCLCVISNPLGRIIAGLFACETGFLVNSVAISVLPKLASGYSTSQPLKLPLHGHLAWIDM